MNSQSAVRSSAEQGPGGPPPEEDPKPGPDAETLVNVGRLYKTKRLFFRFEIGMRKASRTPTYSATDLQSAQAGRPAAGAPPMLMAAPKVQALASNSSQFGTAGQPLAVSVPGSTDTTKSVYFDATVGVTDMPPPNPPGPPQV